MLHYEAGFEITGGLDRVADTTCLAPTLLELAGLEVPDGFGSPSAKELVTVVGADWDEAAFQELADHWDGLDAIVHSIGFAPRKQLEGEYIDAVTREGFAIAHDISSYSFAALAKAGRELMKGRNGSLLTMSYLGAVRAVPNYNVMGLAKASLEANVRYLAASLGPEGTRVNAISAGPIRTLAASGIADFRTMLKTVEERTPLRRNVTTEEVGNAAAFLCSSLASGITGDVLYVDTGYNILGQG
jgi:enoyl-[acyl-carrier protein] reductase I